MPTCKHCETDHETTALDRHEHEGRVVVRCPSCETVMGTWRDRSSPRGRGR